MDPLDLARWTRFAAKGGIGKCTALRDCIAQSQEDLMFLQDDEIVVLMQVTSQEGIYLGFCEGVVGKFSGVNVRFHGKLKKPIITRRPGSVTPSPVLTGRPVVSSPTPSDPSSPRFHNYNHTKTESESEHNAGETGPSGPSEQSHYSQSLNHSHSHSHGRGTPSYVHDQSSRSNTRANSAEGSDSPSIETPARRSEEQQSHLLAIEVVDERGRLSNPLNPLSPSPIQHNHLATRQEKDDGSDPAVPKPAPSHRHEVVSAIYVPFKQRTSSPEDIPEPQAQESAEGSIAEDAQSGKSEPQEAILHQRKQRESLSSSSRQTPEEREPTSAGASTEEPFSPSSQYTKEGGASDESHIVRDSAAISDGGFGIGLSLLQGLADGDRSSVSWSESGHDHEERNNVRQSIPNPPVKLQPQEETVPVPTSPNELTALVNVSAWNNSRISDMSAFSTVSAGRKESVKSESEAGDGLQWNDDDIFDDYRYSRYSVASKGSKQSRSSTVPSLLQNSKVPPLPEEGRPSLEGRVSIRYTDSPRSGTPSSLPPFARGLPPLESGRPSLDSQASSKSTDSLQPALGAILAAPKPLNIIKNVGRGPSPSGSPGSSSKFDHEDIRTRTASNTPLGMASIMREQIDNELKSVNQFTTSITTPRQSEDRHTPTPSVESLHIESSTMDTLPPTTSNDYNGDESSTEEPSPVEMEPPAADNNNAAAFLSLDTSESRTSLFLPHPGAPKPVTNNGQVTPRTPAIYSALSSGSSGPSSPPPPVSRAPLNNGIPEMPPAPPASPLHSALSQAAQKARSVQGTTLYASTQLDLLSSFGPVPIIFSLDQLPPPSPRTPDLGIPRPPASPRIPSPLGLGMDASNMINRGSSPQPIPRANFFPTAGGPRPRSRSFSGFSMNNMDGPEVLFPLGTPGRSREEGSQPAARGDLADYRASLRGSSPLGSGPRSQSRSPSRGPSRNQRPAHVPSPLSLPAINNPSTSSPNASSVPLPRSPNVNPPSPSTNSFGPGPGRNGPGSMRGRVLRQVSSSSAIRPTNNAPPEFVSSNQPPPDFRETSPTKPSPRRSTSQAVPPKLSYEDPEGRPDIALPNQNGGAPMTRSLSLKQKLSMSGLRSKVTTGRPSRDGDSNTMNLTSPISNGSHEEEDRVQIKDMEFELVKPNIRPNGYRGSEDGMGHITSPIETGSIHSGLEGRGGQWRSESPAFSPAAAHLRSPLRSQSVDSFARPGPSGASPPGATQAVSIEAHRMREQKWMSLISSTPSSQARKSKKVKKLLLEGVPSSVRGRVWGHVIDSHARRMQGLFGQLVQKAPKKFVPLVEQDIERCFSDFPHLRDPRGSLSQVILAYTAMVPDIRYRTGLTRIAGHLLLQAPDEDAFWIFVAVMDNLLRGYYHVTNTGQFEIDASLFQNLVETAEPELAKFLFNDYGIRPIDICGSWFSSLFAGVLPPDHLYRVWDILFYEGSIYLFRVALTILTMCKNTLLSLNPGPGRAGPEAIVDILSRPPATAIPQDPEAFLNYTFTVKVRDDDLRKQRSKKEAQWKKERLSQR